MPLSKNKPRLVLASGSEIRAAILRSAGVGFEIERTGVDEDVIKQEGLQKGHRLPDIALNLARAKAAAAIQSPDSYIIGSDQILEFEGKPFDKPSSMDEARTRLASFAGKQHSLINATTLFYQGQEVWHNIERPILYMREISEKELDHYFEACDDSILKSVGAYQVEKYGSRLLERIDGDYFAVLGLALYPLLAALRQYKVIDF